MIKTRCEPQANYKAIFINGKTIRMPIDPKKTITELHYPEFYDVSFGTRCSGGCDYCYASALKAGVHYTNLADKIVKFFGAMTATQRPYQMACGGQSESMENPECWEALAAFVQLGIVPNLTTNGMFINAKSIEQILKYCGGVAVTLHPHLEKFWKRAIQLLHDANLKLNVHVIISDKDSVDHFIKFYKEYASKVDYFVLLPRMNVGHAAKNPMKVDLVSLENEVDTIYSEGKLAFGANFYPWLVRTSKKYDCAIYPPEIFSKYILLNDSLELFNNSFEMKSVPFTPGIGCELGHSRTAFELI